MRVALFLLVLLSSCGPTESELLQRHAEDAVKRQLRDPESARFSDIRVWPASKLVCGHVNAKNGFGGYTGDDLFAYQEGVGAYIATADIDGYTELQKKCHAELQAETERIKARTERTKAQTAETVNRMSPEAREEFNRSMTSN